MHIAIVGPIATREIAHLLDGMTTGLPPGYSGAPLMVTLISELLGRGHRVTVITTTVGIGLDWRQPVRVKRGNLEMVYVPARRHAWRPNGWRLGRIVDLYGFERRGLTHAINEAAPDVIHAHWAYEFAWAANDTGLPTLVTCHDSPYAVARMFIRDRLTQSVYRWLRFAMAWHVLRGSRHVNAVSPYLRDQIQRYCRAQVVVVPNPLPSSLLDGFDQKDHLPDPRFPLLVMVVNGWIDLKNPVPPLRAFASLKARRPGARLKIFGADFGEGERAQQWARRNGLAEGIEFVGHVPYDHLFRELAKADVLIHPSLEESFGMSVAEAMALGIPVVGGAHSGAVPWVVGDGGILTDVTSAPAIGQAIVELVDNPARYRAASKAARVRVLNSFSAGVVAGAYETIYRQILGAAEPA